MTRETAMKMAAEFIMIELIGEGITTKEALIAAMQNKEVQDRVKMCADTLQQEFSK